MPRSGRPQILAVEDNQDAQLLLKFLLAPRYKPTIVAGFDQAMQLAINGGFEIYLLDINLGEYRTGIDLLQSLRAMSQDSYVPAVALTAYALPGDPKRFIEAGFDGYVSKPFTQKILHDAIDDLLEQFDSE